MVRSLAAAGLCAGLVALMSFEAAAQSGKRVPRFEDYAVKDVYEGKSAKPVLVTEEERQSETYFQAIADEGTNFAGHYAVLPLTCGTECISADYLDLRTGKLITGQISNSGWKQRHDAFREVEFRRGSRLIVFAGQINQKGPVGWHFYVFNAGKMKRVHTIVTKDDFRKPLSEWMK